MAGCLGRCVTALWVGITLVVSVPTFAGEPRWIEVKSPHFSVVTDSGEKRGREVAVRFEQMRAVFGALLVKANSNLPVPLQIVAFRDAKELVQFAPLWHGKPTQVAGLFLGNNDRCFILLDLSAGNPSAVVFHEYAHQLMNGNLSGTLDPWFEEGFAGYFSSIEVDGNEARVGRVPEDTYRILQQTGLMKTVDLFRVQQNSGIYNESGDRRSRFYAQSSMVVHYLYDNALIGKLQTYFEQRDQNVSVEDAVQHAFGMNTTQFDGAIRIYVSNGRYKYFKLPTSEGTVTTNYRVTPLSPADANAVLADAHLHSQDYEAKATQEFEAILKADPSNVAALRGLGYACLMKQDFGGASKYFQRAAEGNSHDPRVHYYRALLLSRARSMGEAAKVAMMTKELETSIALDPDLADAYSLLAFAYAAKGQPEKALETMRMAVVLSPRNEMYLFNLGQMYLHNREPAEALVLFQRLRSSPASAVATRAGEMLEVANEMKRALDAGENLLVTEMGRSGEKQAANSREVEQNAKPEQVSALIRSAQAPTRSLNGELVSVDCSEAPEAELNLAIGATTLKLHVGDTTHVAVMNAEAFSCDWTNRPVAVNYHETSEGTGEVVSVELQ
jgi:Tfp pilus assembly protein PilF